MTATTQLSSGTLVNHRYRIKQVLGKGGMGRAYLVSDELGGEQEYVLKECSPQTNNVADLEKYYQLFEREAKILQKLDHPQIPRFYAQFTEDGRFFLVQQYIAGQTYWKALKEQNCPFSESEITQWLKDLLSVVDYLHQQGVIHRDIAPDNIMKAEGGGKPILIDFGAVKEANPAYSVFATGIHKQGYSSPEQARGTISAKSDLYSLAVTAIVLLTGKEPQELFHGESMAWEWRKYATVSEKLGQILDKMLADKPQERYQSAKEVLSAFNIAATELSLSTDVSPTVKINIPKSNRKSNPKTLIISGIASVLLLGGVGVVIQSSHIPLLCKQLDNCARDEAFQQQYTKLLKGGTNSLTAVKQAKTLSDLKIARNNLQKTLTDLKTIPQNTKIYPQVRQTLAKYQTQLQDLDRQVTKEKTAEQQLSQVQNLKNLAINKTKKAKNIEQYQQAKSQWKQIEKQLKTIPLNVFIGNDVKTQIGEAQTQQKTLQEKLIAIEYAQRKSAPANPKFIAQPRGNQGKNPPKSRTKSYIPKSRPKSYPKTIPAPVGGVW